MPDKRLQNFKDWLAHADQDIEIHPEFYIKRNANKPGYGVYARRAIAEDEIVMRVPKQCLLSPQTCGIANLLNEAELDNMMAVCLAFLFERHQGEASPWYPYCAMMPESVGISKLWTKAERRLLHGTEVQVVGGTTLSDFQDMYKESVQPFIEANQSVIPAFCKSLTFDLFCYGMSIVGSRVFGEVDVFHKLSLCPFADMLDHTPDEHVHFTTQYEVCEVCGQSGQCGHTEEAMSEDDEGSSDAASQDAESDKASSHSDDTDEDDSDDLCDFITCRPIEAGSEVYNTYGECGNDVLLARYGFALLENPYDRLSLWPEVSKRADAGVYFEWLETNAQALCEAIQWPESIVNDLEEAEEDDMEDLFLIHNDGRLSTMALLFCMLSLIPAVELANWTGPQVKTLLQAMFDGLDYLDNPLPLPIEASFELKSMQGFVAIMQEVIQARQQRNKTVLAEHGVKAELEALDEGITETHKTQAWHKHFSLIVIRNEQAIAQRALVVCTRVERNRRWLSAREQDE